MPFSRLTLRTQKTTTHVVISSILLLFGLVFMSLQFFYAKSQQVVQAINYTQLRQLAETSGALAVEIDGELMTSGS